MTLINLKHLFSIQFLTNILASVILIVTLILIQTTKIMLVQLVIRELTNRWLPRGRRRLNTRSSLCACATGCGIISRVVLKEATTSEERFWSRLPSNASKGTFCSEYLLNLTLNPQIPSKYANRSFPETSFYFIECYSRHWLFSNSP